MAKFRRNHERYSSRNRGFLGGLIWRFFLLGILVIAGILWWTNSAEDILTLTTSNDHTTRHPKENQDPHYYLPTGDHGEIIHHRYFTLSYNEKHEQANWVAYELSAQQIYAENVSRSDYFDTDPYVTTESASYGDYKGSGYTKGHLVPSADRNFSRQANIETFYMSNISPQIRAFNSGIWNELEMTVRNWAVDNKKIIVVTGPILHNRLRKKIGRKTQVTVPEEFFKVILDNTPPERKGIAFVIPNELSTRPLTDYVLSIDEVEQKTGLDFFSAYLDPAIEKRIEEKSEITKWDFDDSLFDQRLHVWNKR